MVAASVENGRGILEVLPLSLPYALPGLAFFSVVTRGVAGRAFIDGRLESMRRYRRGVVRLLA